MTEDLTFVHPSPNLKRAIPAARPLCCKLISSWCHNVRCSSLDHKHTCSESVVAINAHRLMASTPRSPSGVGECTRLITTVRADFWNVVAIRHEQCILAWTEPKPVCQLLFHQPRFHHRLGCQGQLVEYRGHRIRPVSGINKSAGKTRVFVVRIGCGGNVR